MNLFFSAIAAIVAIIWKPGFTVTNSLWVTWALSLRNCECLQQLCTRSILSFFVEFFAANAWLRRTIQPNFTFYRERKQKRTNFSLSFSLPLDIFRLAELANWNNRSEVSRNAKSLFRFLAIRCLAFAVNFGVKQS